jgi:DNA ligase-1
VDGSFAAWAATAEAIGATTKRLEKGAVLARYLAGLDAASLAVAARFFGGTVFPHHDARTTQVGPSLLTGALVAVAGADPAQRSARRRARPNGGPI